MTKSDQEYETNVILYLSEDNNSKKSNKYNQ